MRCPRPWVVGVLVAAALTPAVRSADAVPALTPEALAARIDQVLAASWQGKDVTPSPRATDAEFLRRLTLDLGGRIPRVQEIRDFLDDPSPDKRKKAVDRLLDSPYYVRHFANVWRAQMIPQTNANPFVQGAGPLLERWLMTRLRQNTTYDKMVQEVLTAQVAGRGMGMARTPQGPDPTPVPFYTANEMKAENLAASTSRLFLGVKLECAQCHNHPFAKWSRQQFWEYAAFFSGITTPQGMNVVAVASGDNAGKKEIGIPGTEKMAQAKFLDGTEPKWQGAASTRQTLADWVTSADNPFFARAAANRLWAHLFGIGIIEPVDEESDDNPASHPELLNELARQLALHGFDLKYLIRAIALSEAYQRSSAVAEGGSPPEARQFARMGLKGLSGEQLYDSIALATGYRETAEPDPRVIGIGLPSPRTEFLGRFSNTTDRRTEFTTSILQALSLMNGKFVADAVSIERSETLAGVLDAPFLDTGGKVDALYLAALSRLPRSEERERMVGFVEKGGPSGNKNKALADVFWALLNSSEFILNH